MRNDAGRAELGRPPEHDHDEGDDAVAEVGRGRRSRGAGRIWVRIDTPGGQPHHDGDEHEVDGELHDVGDEHRDADVAARSPRCPQVARVAGAATGGEVGGAADAPPSSRTCRC